MRSLQKAAAVLAALTIVGCSESPTSPAAPSGSGPSGTTTSLVKLVVTGQGQIKVKATTPLTATAHFSDGTTTNMTSQAEWATSNAGVCSVGESGMAMGVGEGTCEVSATYTAVSGRFNLDVSPDPASPGGPGNGVGGGNGGGNGGGSGGGGSGGGGTGGGGNSSMELVELTITGPGSVAVGQTVAWTASGVFEDGSRHDFTTRARWSTEAPGVASAAAGGQITGVSAGSTTVVASVEGKSASGGIVVSSGAPTVTGLSIQGPPCSVAGASSQLQAIAQMSDGTTQNRTSTATWTTGNAAVATVSTGLVQCVDAGSTNITATIPGPFSASVTVTVTTAPPTVLSLAVSGDTSIEVGETSQLQAVATMSNGTTQNVTSSSTWVSATTAVATVSATGLVSGVSPGTSQVSATYQGKSASVTMTVTAATPEPPTVTGLTIQGPPCTVVGGSNQLQAIAQMSDGTTQNKTATATWASSSPAIATVPGGLMQCKAPGTTTISATIPGPVTGSIIVTVTAAPKQLIGIRVDLEGNVLTGNGPVGLSFTSLLQDPLLTVNVFALYSDGSEQNVTALTAISTSTPLLVVNGPGVVNAAGVLTQALINPSHYINVTYQGFTVIANVTINVPVLGHLPITGLLTNGTLTHLNVGTKLPDLTAILSGPGVAGTVHLLIPAATSGIQWNIRPKLLSNCGLLATVCATVNSALQGLGNLANGVVTILDGKVTHLSLGHLNSILAPVVVLLGGVLEVDVNPIINGIVGPAFLCRIPLG